MLFKLCKLRYPKFSHNSCKILHFLCPSRKLYTLDLESVCMKVFIDNAVSVLITLKLKTSIWQ